jgi:two-component system, cell cycle response regulator CpdR
MCASSAGAISPAATYEQDRQVQLNKDLLVNKDLLAKESASMPRVLIADDEDSMRTLVARAIAMDGHDIVTAEDGAEALEILSREQGAFDLLLTDIQMPVMDGIALALTAARDFPELTILLMTGFADQRERASGLNAIVHDVVTKPFSVADIRTAVAEALAARKSAERV